jgi:plasmid stability protein
MPAVAGRTCRVGIAAATYKAYGPMALRMAMGLIMVFGVVGGSLTALVLKELSRSAGCACGRYHGISLWEARMTDMLIRDVPDEVIAAVDARASRLGLSRSEYVRRRLAQDAATGGTSVTAQDLARFAEAFEDLGDPDVMSRAWQ